MSETVDVHELYCPDCDGDLVLSTPADAEDADGLYVVCDCDRLTPVESFADERFGYEDDDVNLRGFQ